MTEEMTQADRDAAERWGTGPVYSMAHLAEAFARHRIQSTAELQARLDSAEAKNAELVEALERLCTYSKPVGMIGDDAYATARAALARAQGETP